MWLSFLSRKGQLNYWQIILLGRSIQQFIHFINLIKCQPHSRICENLTRSSLLYHVSFFFTIAYSSLQKVSVFFEARVRFFTIEGHLTIPSVHISVICTPCSQGDFFFFFNSVFLRLTLLSFGARKLWFVWKLSHATILSIISGLYIA
jgi:hypothetical protein